MRKHLRRSGAELPALLGTMLIVLALAGCTSGPDRRFATEPVARATVIERVSAPGTVQASAQAELKAPAAARIQSLGVRDGAQVGAGAMIAQLTSPELDQAAQQAQSALNSASSFSGIVPSLSTGQAIAALGQMQAEVTSSSDSVLSALKVVVPLLPPAQRAKAAADLAAAEQRVAAAQAAARDAAAEATAAANQQTRAARRAVDAATAAQRNQAALALAAAQSRQRQLTLRSPISGTVQLGRGGGGAAATPDLSGLPAAAQQALQGLAGSSAASASPATGPPLRVGSQVSAGQTVASVLDVSRLTVATQVDETDVALVRRNQAAHVEFDAFPGSTFRATVARIAVGPSGQSNAAGGVSYEVDLTLGEAVAPDEAGSRPVPKVGMTATAEIEVRRATGAPSVPSSALIGRGSGQAVVVVSGDRVRLRPVQVSVQGDDRVAIASGILPGERVVSRGADRLKDGQSYPGP